MGENSKEYKDFAFILEKLRDTGCSFLLERFFDSNTLLHVAARLGHDQIVEAILSKQQCQELLTAKNSSGDLPLHVAVNAGNLRMVQLLLNSSNQCQELLTTKNSRGDLPLHVAVNARHLRMVQLLLRSSDQSQELLTAKNSSGDLPLHVAVNAKNPRMVQLLLNSSDQCQELLAAKNSSGDLPLHVAVNARHLRMVQLMLQSSDQCQELLAAKSSSGDLPLHVAVNAGEMRMVQLLLESSDRCQELLAAKNSSGDLPLHVAVKGGDLPMVELLLKSSDQCQELLAAKNSSGDLPLHVAVNTWYLEIVELLLKSSDQCQELLAAKNSSGDLPLHVAVNAGCLDIVELLVNSNVDVACPLLKEKNKEGITPLHLALIKKYSRWWEGRYADVAKFLIEIVRKAEDGELMEFVSDILDTVLQSLPNDILTVKYDERMTPLTYAASIGYLRGVESLLGETTIPCVYGENTRYYPIHIATWKGHIKVVAKFLHKYPDMIELLTDAGQNILHVAAMYGKAKMLAYMLKRHDLKVEMLINNKDQNGNTPLHLAAMRRHPMVVSMLTWDKRVDLKALNNKGERALDIALNYSGENPSFRERLTWEALRYISGPRAPPRRVSGENPQCSEDGTTLSTDKYKDRTGTLLLVATLVAGVTFAAAFTMPGGYKESGGMAKFLEKPMFHVFVISNSIAMYSAITAVVTFIWAYLDDLNLFIAAYKFGVPVLGLAITMVSLAFMAGNYLVLRDNNWLAYLVLSIGSFFLFTLSIIFFPLCLPNSSPHPIIRYIVRYPFHLLIKFTGCDTDDFDECRETGCDTDDFDECRETGCDTDDSEEGSSLHTSS